MAPLQRFSKVPWLGPQDLEPFGKPESTIEHEGTIAHLLRVPVPFGRDTDAVLMITAAWSGLITASVIDGPVWLNPAPEVGPIHSNPRRVLDDEEDEA